MLSYKDKSHNLYTYKILYILRIIILIFLFLSFKISFIKKNKNNSNYNKRYLSNINGNYSLYDSFKYPQISIIIPDIDILALKNNIFKLIMNLQNQTLNNIEIILTSAKDEFKEYKDLESLCLKDKRIKLIKFKKKELINNLFSLMKLLKGKYVFILKKYFDFKRNDFEKFYQFTLGKIKNIFEFKKKNKSLFLIKSKILRDINDNNINFKNFSRLIEYITSLPEPKLNYISISLSTSNKYISLIYVCMTSILYSKNAYTYIIFYLLIPKGFIQKNIDFLKTLHEQYDYFNITFIEIDNRYDKAFTSRHITKEAYFKFSLGELIPHLNKILYLDNDVIVFKDLTNLYNMNFNDKMILGQPAFTYNISKKTYYSINSGILLLNLKKMRELHVEKRILNAINKKEKFDYHDQTIINSYFKEYIGDYPPENQARAYNISESIIFNNKSGKLYNKDYFLFSWKYPTMRHYIGHKKPNHLDSNNIILEDWWYFARLSKYFYKKTKNIKKIFNYTFF